MEVVLPALLEQPDISIDTALPSLSVPCCVVVGFVCSSGFTRVTMIVKRKEKKKKKKEKKKNGKKKKKRTHVSWTVCRKVLAHHQG